MTDNPLLFKAAISAACVIGWWLTVVLESRMRPQVRRWWPAAVWIVTRPLLALLVFVVLGMPVQSDVPAYYHPQGQQALAGGLTYRDFPSSYAPLFPYLCAIPAGLWDSPKSIVFFSLLWELVAIAAWKAFAGRVMDRVEVSKALSMYVWNPMPILVTAIGGQNQTWIAALWGLSALWLATRPLLSGMTAAASVVCVKILGLLAVPVLFLGTASRWKFVIGFALAGAAVFGSFVLAGADVLQPVRYEGGQTTCGNLPYLLTVFGFEPSHPAIGLMLQVVLLVALSGVWLWLAWKCRGRLSTTLLPVALSTVMLVFMLVSKKAYMHYLVMFGLPLCMAVAQTTRRDGLHLLFMVFSGMAALEPSMWFRFMGERGLEGAITGGLKPLTFLMTEVVLVTGYAVLLVNFMRRIHQCSRQGTGARN